MTEKKKEHHLTKAKRLREEAKKATVESVEAPVEWAVSSLPDAPKPVGDFWCYDARANLRYRAKSEDEARLFIRQYPGWFYNNWPQ